MKVRMKYFARIAELIEKREEELEVKEGILLIDLISFLIDKYGENLENYLLNKKTKKIKDFFKILINGEISQIKDIKIQDNSEIVIIPPVSGG